MNLILGSSSGLTYLHLRPFLETLARTSFSGDVVFFISERDRETIEKIQNQVQVVTFSPTLLTSNPIHALRYFLYEGFLKKNKDKYHNVMITDVRDVIFQKDPFDFGIKGLSVFMEDATIGSCPYNSRWIETKYGAKEKDELASKPVSCSGITIAPTPLMLNYLSLMKKSLLPALQMIGYDQGVHNYLLHRGLLQDAQIYTNDSGPVLTMQYMNHWNWKNDKIQHTDGSPVNILHQYDRFFSTIYSNPQGLNL